MISHIFMYLLIYHKVQLYRDIFLKRIAYAVLYCYSIIILNVSQISDICQIISRTDFSLRLLKVADFISCIAQTLTKYQIRFRWIVYTPLSQRNCVILSLFTLLIWAIYQTDNDTLLLKKYFTFFLCSQRWLCRALNQLNGLISSKMTKTLLQS